MALSREERFRAFYLEEYDAVARYCYQLVRSRHLAEDLAQEAFVRVLSRWLAVREPRAYVFHVATNLVRRAWRDRARESVGVHDDERVSAPADLSVRDAVDRLPARYRELVLLHYYADLTVTDVAAALGKPEGTVKRMLSEARARLATTLRSDHE